jgi:hypothetical protein
MIELYQLPNDANGTVEATPKRDEDAPLVVPIILPLAAVGQVAAAARSSFTRDAFLGDLRKIKKEPKAPADG